MMIARLAAVASLVALTATGCAANSEPEESQAPAVVVTAPEKDPGAPPAAVETGAVSPEARREVCRWMTCTDVGESRPYRCYVCF